jgi:hypothetical protein
MDRLSSCDPVLCIMYCIGTSLLFWVMSHVMPKSLKSFNTRHNFIT